MYVSVCVCEYVCVSVQMCVSAYMCVSLRKCVSLCICVCVSVRMTTRVHLELSVSVKCDWRRLGGEVSHHNPHLRDETKMLPTYMTTVTHIYIWQICDIYDNHMTIVSNIWHIYNTYDN